MDDLIRPIVVTMFLSKSNTGAIVKPKPSFLRLLVRILWPFRFLQLILTHFTALLASAVLDWFNNPELNNWIEPW